MKKQSEMDASCWRKGKTLDASNAEVSSVSEDGAGGGTRTHTESPPADFESATSTNSITPALFSCCESHFFGPVKIYAQNCLQAPAE